MISYRNDISYKSNVVNTIIMITEDGIVDFVDESGGLLITRKKVNHTKFSFNTAIACLTGYNQIISKFYNDFLPKFNEKIILIIIETDDFILTQEMASHPLIKHIYCWNKPLNHPKVSAIPIGLNYDRQHDVLFHWLEQNKATNLHDKLLCVNYSPNTNSVRGALIQKANTEWKGFCDVLGFIPNQTEYWRPSHIEGKIRINVTNPKCYDVMSQYKFVLSPPGAGMDCHRTWEALYIGCIPIVITSKIDELYEELPIVVVKDWSEITKEFLERKYDEVMKNKQDNKYNMEKLELKYWTDKLVIDKTPTRNIHFITYGNDKFEKAKTRIVKEAHVFGEFNSVKAFGPEHLPKDFTNNYEQILNMPRGGGYWIWRPIIIQQALDKMNDDEYLVYLDAGCTINTKGKHRFNEYLQLLDDNKNKYGILSFQMSGNNGPGSLEKEKFWTTKQIFDYFEIEPDSSIGNSGQYLGGVLVMKKNEHLLTYMKEYTKTILSNPVLCTDYFNNQLQHQEFRENRHEQSITSILRKKMGSVVVDGDESWMVPFGQGESLKYPFWASRKRD